jgi:hypothetical protein
MAGQGKSKSKAAPQIVMAPRKNGRPTSYTQEIADELCAHLAMGESLRTACSADGMPSVATVFNWFKSQDGFLEQYTRAKEEAADAMAEDILDIADDGTNDYMTITRGNSSYEVVNSEAIARSKLRVESRKWLMAKMKPKRYGDKLDVTSDGKELPQPISPLILQMPNLTDDIKNREGVIDAEPTQKQITELNPI